MNYNDTSEDERKNTSPASKAFGIVFLIWFLMSVLLMVIFSNTPDSGWRIVFLFGQLFGGVSVIGLISNFLQKKRLNMVLAAVGFIGIAVAVMALKYHHFTPAEHEKFEKQLPVLAISGFILVGISILIDRIYEHFYMKKH